MCYLGNLEFGLLWNKYRVHTVELWITAAVGGQMIVQTILTGEIGISECEQLFEPQCSYTVTMKKNVHAKTNPKESHVTL